jgi:hypothetical protein
MGVLRFSESTAFFHQNNVKQLMVAMETQCDLFEVGTAFFKYF